MTRTALFLGAALALLPLRTRADFHVFSPYEIDLGEIEIEHNGDAQFDRLPANSGATSYTLELGTGLTAWWHSEVELGFDRDPGFNQPTLLTQAVTENTFQLTEPGKYFADFGFYFEYAQSLTRGAHAGPNAITFGPLIAKDIGRTTTTVNLFLTRQLGPDQGPHGLDFSYAWQTRWNIWPLLSPAIEFYGDTGNVGQTPGFAQQEFLIGPVGVGSVGLNQLGLGNAGKLKYELGWLFGATRATPQGTLRWRLELEIPF
jgi:hypothetical protein